MMYSSVLHNRNFILYGLSWVLSKAGTSISAIAFLLLVYNSTHSGVETAGVALAETIPYALFGLIGGVAADRLRKKRTLVSLDAVQGMILITSTSLYYFHALTYLAILVITFLIETIGCVYNPTSRAVLPIIIRPDDRVPANSLMDISTRGTQLAGPAAAYFLLHWIGYGAFFIADGASYLLSASIILFLHVPHTPHTASNPPSTTKPRSIVITVYQPIAQFAKFAWRIPDVRNLFLATTLVVFFNTWVWQIGLLLQAESLFHNGEQAYSLFLICFTVFSIGVSLVVPFRFKALRISHYLMGAALWGVGIIGIGIAHHGGLIAIFAMVVGVGMPIASLSRVFMLQDKVPDTMRGRAFSFSAVLLYLSNTVSLALFGMMSHFVSIRALFDISGLGIILITCVYALLVKLAPLCRRHTMDASKFPIER